MWHFGVARMADWRTSQMKLINLVGKRFGKLVVIERAENRQFPCGASVVCWKCRCDCGNIVTVCGSGLRNGTKSCGCAKNKYGVESHFFKHGECQTRLYKTWEGMRKRCKSKYGKDYPQYAGKGIKVCDEWNGENGYENFKEWAYANGYDESKGGLECSIDRIDNNKGYSPENCRWATAEEQANNRNTSRTLTYNGETHAIAEWARKLNAPYGRIQSRVYLGWTPREIIETPMLKANRKFGTKAIAENGRKE